MPKPVILASAWEDIEDIAEYHLRRVGPQSAAKVTDSLLDTIELLETMPFLGPVHDDPVLQLMGFRKLLCRPYVCIYRIIDNIPTVYDVFHERRDYPSDFGSRR